MNDIDKATNAKFLVEQKQREEARERKETSGEWANKVIRRTVSTSEQYDYIYILFSPLQYFKAVGDSWIYYNPLLHRLTLEKRDSKR